MVIPWGVRVRAMRSSHQDESMESTLDRPAVNIALARSKRFALTFSATPSMGVWNAGDLVLRNSSIGLAVASLTLASMASQSNSLHLIRSNNPRPPVCCTSISSSTHSFRRTSRHERCNFKVVNHHLGRLPAQLRYDDYYNGEFPLRRYCRNLESFSTFRSIDPGRHNFPPSYFRAEPCVDTVIKLS